MKKLDNPTLQKFIYKLVEAFKRENEERKWHVKKQKELDIPFLISSLYQSFKNNVDNYKDFINDMKDKYKLKPTDKINKMIENMNMITSFLDVLK